MQSNTWSYQSKIPQKGEEEECPQEWEKDESIHTLSPAIDLEGCSRQFEHEYIVKLSKKDPIPSQLNLMLNSNQGLTFFRQTQTLTRHKRSSQQGVLSAMFPFSTLIELIFLSYRYY